MGCSALTWPPLASGQPPSEFMPLPFPTSAPSPSLLAHRLSLTPWLLRCCDFSQELCTMSSRGRSTLGCCCLVIPGCLCRGLWSGYASMNIPLFTLGSTMQQLSQQDPLSALWWYQERSMGLGAAGTPARTSQKLLPASKQVSLMVKWNKNDILSSKVWRRGRAS